MEVDYQTNILRDRLIYGIQWFKSSRDIHIYLIPSFAHLLTYPHTKTHTSLRTFIAYWTFHCIRWQFSNTSTHTFFVAFFISTTPPSANITNSSKAGTNNNSSHKESITRPLVWTSSNNVRIASGNSQVKAMKVCTGRKGHRSMVKNLTVFEEERKNERNQKILKTLKAKWWKRNKILQQQNRRMMGK